MDKLEGMEIGSIGEDIGVENENASSTAADEMIEAENAYEATEVDTDESQNENGGTGEDETDSEPVDYEKIIREDLIELRGSFSELAGISSITELPNPMRYAALRDLGLTAKEAYLATSERKAKDNRSHLSSAVPGGIGAPKCNMTRSELEGARELFPNLRDGELIGLYKKVNL